MVTVADGGCISTSARVVVAAIVSMGERKQHRWRLEEKIKAFLGFGRDG